MAMKRHSTFPKTPGLKPHHQMLWCYIQETQRWDFSVWLVHIHYKLICSCLCSAEQNNKASWKNNNKQFIFMTESRLVSEWEIFFVCRMLQVAAVIFGDDRQCWSVPWQATGERSFYSACQVLSALLGNFQKGLEKKVL